MKHRDRGEPRQSTLEKLLDLGAFNRNQLTLAQVNRLRDLIDREGSPRAAELVGVCEITLLRVCAGFGHRLRPPTAAAVRKYLGID